MTSLVRVSLSTKRHWHNTMNQVVQIKISIFYVHCHENVYILAGGTWRNLVKLVGVALSANVHVNSIHDYR